MKSPFPGMDPYLDRNWLDVHHSLITYASDQLQARLPKGLRARIGKREFIESDAPMMRVIYPDVHVYEKGGKSGKATGTGVAVAEPLILEMETEPLRQGFVEIVDAASGNRVVTVIEFVSPANKTSGAGLAAYQKKQHECVQAGVSLVEIDLTRAGDRRLILPPFIIPASHRTTYQIWIRRGWKKSVELYRAPLAEPLPTIAVPLREKDVDVPLQLQTLIDQCYDNGRYDDLNYRESVLPPLEGEEAAWADELLRSKGNR